MNDIFGDEILQQNVVAVVSDTGSLPIAERYEFLADWVLPGRDHTSFRLPMAFSATDDVSLIVPAGSDVGASSGTTERGFSAGSNLMSPATDLVRVAVEQGKLSALRQRIEDSPADGLIEQRCRLTMLTLVDLAGGQFETAERNLAILDQWLREVKTPISNCPETLAMMQGIRHSETRDISREMISYLLNSFVRETPNSGMKPWDRLMVGLSAAAGSAELSQLTSKSGPERLDNWVPVSHPTAFSHGMGYPEGQWLMDRGVVRNLASHDSDYLYYRIPLRGDFEVECDVTDFSWRHSHLSVAGTWVAPAWGLKTYDLGSFRSAMAARAIEPPLSIVNDWIRYRTVVRNRTATTYFNGRRIHEQPLDIDHAPWIAIRSPWYADGSVRDLKITGHPDIPDQLSLSGPDCLASWTSYFGDPDVQEWFTVPGTEPVEIACASRPDLQGTGSENLLQYNRPMLEDGTIEYEFYYGPDHVDSESGVCVAASPAIDRLAFVLTNEGIRIHEVTDGRFDGTDRDPLRLYSEPDSQRGPERLPLRPDAWNQLALRLNGDAIQLSLNSQLVFETVLKPDGPRRFGLFHYSDAVDTRVRNIRWKGSWPKMLPGEADQQLAASTPPYPEPVLKHMVRHDFTKDDESLHLFELTDLAEGLSSVKRGPDGLLMKCPGSVGYQHCFLSTDLRVEGDFDITASFDSLTTDARENGSSGISLRLVLAEDSMRECSVFRGLTRRPRTKDRQEVHLMEHWSPNNETRSTWHGTTSEECRSGRLRFIRQGTSLYSLLAERDSPHYRLISQREVSTAAIERGHLRLAAQMSGPGIASVTWKDITVRAERLSGAAVEHSRVQLEALNRKSEQLPDQWDREFSDRLPSGSDFYVWPVATEQNRSNQGYTIFAPGSDTWNTAGINVQRVVRGNFDIGLDFRAVRFATARPGQLSSIYLAIDLPATRSTDTDSATTIRPATRAVLAVTRNDAGIMKAIAERRSLTADGDEEYRSLGAIRVADVSRLRLVRNDGRLTFVVSSVNFPGERVIGSTDCSDGPIEKANIRFIVHTGGSGLESEVLLKSISIRADDVQVDSTARLPETNDLR
jgi:hypothetical protein